MDFTLRVAENGASNTVAFRTQTESLHKHYKGRWDGWGHLKYFLIRKPKDRTSMDFWASGGAGHTLVYVCVCVSVGRT